MMDTVEHHALVLSGGGAKGAYEVGVIKALARGESPATGRRPMDFEIYTGTSVGAYNAAFLTAQADLPEAEAAAKLEQVWLGRIADSHDTCGNGVFRIRGLPTQLFDPGCFRNPAATLGQWLSDGAYLAGFGLKRGVDFAVSSAPPFARVSEVIDLAALFSPEPFYSLVADTIPLDGLRASHKRLTIATSNWADGTVRLFTCADLAGAVGTGPILASGAIPGIFPPVEVGGVPYVDGGILMNTPLRPAIRAGADVLHVIYLDPFVDQLPFPNAPNTLDTFFRLWVILQRTNVDRDIARAEAINEALGGEPGEAVAPSVSAAAKVRLARRRRSTGQKPYRPLVIHRYRPTSDLGGGGGLLDFQYENIANLIQLGYEDTLQHDCDVAGCTLLPGVAPRSGQSLPDLRMERPA